MRSPTRLLTAYRDRVVAGTTGLFAYAPYPLERTLAHRGDPGLFGPDSVTWPVIGDVAAFFGGVRALLLQAAHPEVVAGVHDHSRYRDDPLGRLSRTSAYVTATAFGAVPEVVRATSVVAVAHRSVRGASHRSRPYAANTPGLAAWVHNTLTDGFLQAYRHFGPRALSVREADRFVREQAELGRMLDADPVPLSESELRRWIADHPDVAPSPGMHEAVRFLRSPPLPISVRVGYTVMLYAAIATIPARLRRILGLRRIPGAVLAGKALSRFLRWALGSSPSWNLALLRCNAPVPDGLFRQPLPVGERST